MDDLLTAEQLMAMLDKLPRRSETAVALYVSPELSHQLREWLLGINSAYLDQSVEAWRPPVNYYSGMPLIVDPELEGNGWYTVDADNNIIALHVARPGSDPVEWGLIQRKPRETS